RPNSKSVRTKTDDNWFKLEVDTLNKVPGAFYVEDPDNYYVHHVTVDTEDVLNQRVDESLTSRIFQLCEGVILTESMTYDQLVAATADYWPTRLETVKYVKAHPPEFVALKGGDVDLAFCYQAHPGPHPKGSGQKHYGAIVFFPDKNKILNKLKG